MPSRCPLNCIDWQQRNPFHLWAQHKKPYITWINKPKSAVTFNRWKITVAVILTWYTCFEVSSISLHKVQRSSNINVQRAMCENTHVCLTHNMFEHGNKMTETAEVPHIYKFWSDFHLICIDVNQKDLTWSDRSYVTVIYAKLQLKVVHFLIFKFIIPTSRCYKSVAISSIGQLQI